MYKSLNMFTKQTDELKKLIAEHSDYPIVVLCNYEVCGDDSYNWWYAPSLYFSIGEILDCEQDVNDERVYSDRDEFEEDLTNILIDSGDYDGASDEEFDAIIKAELAKYEPYWKKVILISADV
jgi:hypothetical protein